MGGFGGRVGLGDWDVARMPLSRHRRGREIAAEAVRQSRARIARERPPVARMIPLPVILAIVTAVLPLIIQIVERIQEALAREPGAWRGLGPASDAEDAEAARAVFAARGIWGGEDES